ncbi:MAG: bifunctional homocysteine S-methyltransferase/methylenetetrahydrofolate reductase [Candidatus Gastranaerophilales bacterium]|nr:bifunctional homocysteine S-methyltransferase/methylenetetrahydrofolate reductase [Candidatus Gastranaerophilales bacterium]
MNKNLLNIIEKMTETPLVFDGAMGTVIYEKGVFINACYDELNMTNPKLIKSIHQDYVNAGCDVILTNTFGANKFKLEKYGLSNKVYEINFEGAKIAKEAANDDVYVLGCVGTCLSEGSSITVENKNELTESFENQIKALYDGGVDGIIFETFNNLEEINIASEIAKKYDLPVIACLACRKEKETLNGLDIKTAVKKLDKNKNIDAIGLNCIIGPHAMLSVAEDVINLTSKPFIVEPNAGHPQNVDGRMIYMSTPEYFATYAQNYIRLGVRGVGGCCGTTPEHIKETAKTVKALTGVKKHLKIDKIEEVKDTEIKITPIELKSNFAKKLFSGEKVKTMEITPPRSVILDSILDKVRECKKAGIDAINIPDGPRASSRISSLVSAIIIEKEVGIETILHYCCRDRNLIGMQSDLLGGFAAGLKNYLIVTGDPPKLGDYPNATAVFDIDAVGLTKVVHNLNHGSDIAGNVINPPTSILIGVGANPCAVDIEKELNHFLNKFNAGAEYAITQPVFDADALLSFMDKADKKGIKIPIVAGIWPLVSLKNALFLKNEVPGVVVPDSIITKMEKAATKEDGIKYGIEIAHEIKEKISSYVGGYQVSAPFGKVDIALEVFK